jgi:hypothetical protein
MLKGGSTPNPARLWAGSSEPIFSALPGTILANFRNPRSENALLWNLLYPRALPSLSLRSLLGLQSLWGTSNPGGIKDDDLVPYYWGFGLDGAPLEGLTEVLSEVDGPGPKTEVDLFLLGREVLIAVEAKHTTLFGRCSRYAFQRCPEIHSSEIETSPCRSWEPGPARFSNALVLGDRPDSETEEIPCNTHYQLARTLIVGGRLAQKLDCIFALWIFLPEGRWRLMERSWLDFVDRVSDDRLWRSMRVISWEQIERIPTR